MPYIEAHNIANIDKKQLTDCLKISSEIHYNKVINFKDNEEIDALENIMKFVSTKPSLINNDST